MPIRPVLALVLSVLAAGCASTPAGTYFPPPNSPATLRAAESLRRAAHAAGDDASRYSFGFIGSPTAAAYSDEEGTFYVTDGLMRLPQPVVDAMIAHEVAHEVLGHMGTRRALALTLTATFSAGGVLVPGVGLADYLVSPLAVRAFSRRQEMAADAKAVEMLWDMGYRSPRRTLAEALRAVDAVAPKPKEGLTGLFDPKPSLEDRLTALEPLEPPSPTAATTPR
jgi:Zn-dependent protease with chaperone function